MEVRSLSATAIRDFLQCQLKLVFRYDREKIGFKNDYARLGIAVHEALDQLTKRMSAKKTFPDVSDQEFAMSVFMHKAVEEGLEQLSFYKQGREIIDKFINRFDPAEEVLEVEYRFKLTTPEGVPIAGAIDKVVKINDNTLAIVDYKTARNALTPYELEDDIQLSMYDLAASLLWPEYENRLLFLDYVRLDKKVSTCRSDEERESFRSFLQSVWTQINKLPEKEVRGKINTLCGWCDYRTYCDEYAALLQSTKLSPIPAITEMSDDEFIEHWEQTAAFRSVVDARLRELKMFAHTRFMEGEDIKGAGKELYSVQGSRTTYDLDNIVDLIPRDDLMSLLTVNKSRLDNYAKNDSTLRNRLSQVAQVSYNAPSYKTRALKEEDLESDDF